MTNNQSKHTYDTLNFDEVMSVISKECCGKSTAEKKKIFTDMWGKYKHIGDFQQQLQKLTQNKYSIG
jgi:hypothetical protein